MGIDTLRKKENNCNVAPGEENRIRVVDQPQVQDRSSYYLRALRYLFRAAAQTGIVRSSTVK